jgi:replicative DNA helicase
MALSRPQSVRQMIPGDPDLERFVLGSILTHPELFHQVRMLLSAGDFLIDRHKRIWKAAALSYDQGNAVDRVTVYVAMKQSHAAQDDEFSYLVSLDEGLPEVANLERHVHLLKEKTTLRRALAASQDISKRCLAGTDNPQAILDAFSKYAHDLVPMPPNAGLQSTKAIIEQSGLTKLLSPRRERGLLLPWPWMNRWTGGMLPSELWVLGGYTGMGKTSAMLQHAIHAARNGAGVAIFSLEMSKESLFSKAAHQIARIPADLGDYVRTSEERKSLASAAAELQDMPLYIDDTSRTVLEIHTAVRRCRLTGNIGLIIVDYLQLLSSIGRHGNKAEEVGANAWACKMLANEFKVPLLLLSGCSRPEKGKESRRPDVYDLKQSGDIENHANVVWLVHGESAKMNVPQATAEFLLAKQREGPRNISCKFAFMPKYQRFEELAEEDYRQ